MCRSIKTLRPPVLPEEATEEEIRAAALQYVRKVSGFLAPRPPTTVRCSTERSRRSPPPRPNCWTAWR